MTLPASTRGLAHVVRSGFVESVHQGIAVVVDPQGDVIFSVGDPHAAIFPRSANKPLQAVGMVLAGLELDGAPLALACASHSGERYHLDGVTRLLAGADLDPSALRNTPGLPLDEQERATWLRLGRDATPLAQNCSGKHAAMLATCQVNGWSLADYGSPQHPLQRQIGQAIQELTGEPAAALGVDGCGAPVPACSTAGLARAFSRIATAGPGTAPGRVAEAIRRHPEWIGGTGRPVTRLLRAVPALIAKDGAEGVFAAALADGRAIAVKIADGAERPLSAIVVALLRRLGVDAGDFDELADVPVLGHGRPVGRIEVVGI